MREQISRRVSGQLKLIVSMVLLLSLCTPLLGSLSVSAYGGGDGGQETPFRIEDCQDLQDINNDLDAYYVLANDIDCAGFANFDPIGNFDDPFYGELDGQGFAVSNLTINKDDNSNPGTPEDQSGLFNQIGDSGNQTGLIKDFGLENVSVTGDWIAGSMVGLLYGELNNVYATGEVFGRGEVGGLVGSHGGEWDTIIDSYSDVDVTATGDTVGGLVGFNAGNANIINSYATGDVSGGDDFAGGLVGVNDGNIQDSHATGTVEADDGTVGGLVGGNSGTVSLSYATGHVAAPNNNAGGFVGRNSGEILKSFANNANAGNQNVGVEADCNVGGFVGFNDGGTVHNSYTRSSSASPFLACSAGGFVGSNNSGIYQVYSTGTVTGSVLDIGGFAGLADTGYINVSFWDTETSGLTDGCGSYSTYTCGDPFNVMPGTTAPMKTQANYVDALGEGAWDFTNIWGLDSTINDGYPFLRDVGATPTDQPENESSSEEDLNGDGIDDTEQPNIGGYVNQTTGKITAIDVGSDCELTTDDSVRESQLAVQDAAYEYESGLWDFEAECTSEVTTIKLYYYGINPADKVLRKHNPVTNAYFTITDAQIASQTIDGQSVTVVTYQIIDNGDLDMNPEEGMIADPAGLAQSVIGAPNTGLR